MRRTLIVGNWKMHKTVAEARTMVRALLADPSWQHPDVDVAIAPAFTALPAVSELLAGNPKLCFGAQTMHWAEAGAYTGEISAPMLVELGCTYALLGHSERRAHCGETDEGVNRKVKSALEHGLTPIVAVGETLEQHEAGEAKLRVTSQIGAAFEGVSSAERARCVVAYEPIWAIGSGLAEDPSSANEVMCVIRSFDAAFEGVQILYGGSVKPGNIAGFMAQPNVDGALVGGASLDPAGFAELVRNARPQVAKA
ncbi:MAG: triose-phosphate isomerase [Vulcanimicrobiaceae bacterium]